MELLIELNDGRWPNLGEEVGFAGAELPPSKQHRAKADAEACRQIILALARHAIRSDEPCHE